jgi:hypothetical protein
MVDSLQTDQGLKQLLGRQDLEDGEKIKFIAYRLWLSRRDSGTPGDAERDYFDAERIFESHRNRKPLLLATFSLWAISFLLGRPAEGLLANSMQGLFRLDDGADVY